MTENALGDRRGLVPPSLGVALLVATVAVAVPAAAEADRVDRLLERADKRYEKHDYERAAELFAKADRAAGGRSLAAIAGITRSSLELLRYDDAIEAAERWIRSADTAQSRAAGYQYLGLALHRREAERATRAVTG